jgi:predicted aconitase
MTLSCTPEIEKNVPAFGEIVAFSESSATPYVNSVLGARTNRESSISALCAAVTGRVPEYGFLLDENRRAEVLVEVEAKVEEDFDWHLLGYAYPQVYKGGEVPVFSGITKRATPEGFVQFGAELATSGSVGMYHIAGITPEAPDVDAALGGTAPKATVKITDADLDRVREQFAGEPGPIEYAMFGCPHLTIRQVGEIAAQIQGRRFAVDTWILVSSLTLELAERMGYLAAINRAGGHVLPDTCMDVPGCWDIYYDRPGVTESQKCAFYCQVLGQRYAVRPLAQAVEAAIAGEVH